MHSDTFLFEIHLLYGQNNVDFRSVRRFHRKCGGAGLISGLRFNSIFANFNFDLNAAIPTCSMGSIPDFFNCIYSWTQFLLHNHTSIFQLMAAWKLFWYYNWGTNNIKFLYMYVWSHPRAVVTLFVNSCAWDKYGKQVMNNKTQGIISATTSLLMCNIYVIAKVIIYIP